MYNASEITMDEVVKKIQENEMGMLLLVADKKNAFDIMAEESSFMDRMGIFGNGSHITCQLFPLRYNKNGEENSADTIRCRQQAISILFSQWKALGYNKRGAKSPFNSKAFMKYLDDVEFTKADYLLLHRLETLEGKEEAYER